jgi:putative Holliday junction resolvase
MAGRYLALDVGERYIGVAVSDALNITAQGLGTLKRSSLERDLAQLADYTAEYDVTTFVVGYPKNMNGTLGERAVASQAFAGLLQEHFPGKTAVLWDERLTTVAAEKTLLEAGVRRQKRKKVIDKLAAVLILQGYLDSISGS